MGHDYLHDLDEIVNPANGPLSVRIEAPRPKERGLNYPVYALMYDSTQQFAVQYREQTGQSFGCAPWTGETPVAPLAERQTRRDASLREISWWL